MARSRRYRHVMTAVRCDHVLIFLSSAPSFRVTVRPFCTAIFCLCTGARHRARVRKPLPSVSFHDRLWSCLSACGFQLHATRSTVRYEHPPWSEEPSPVQTSSWVIAPASVVLLRFLMLLAPYFRLLSTLRWHEIILGKTCSLYTRNDGSLKVVRHPPYDWSLSCLFGIHVYPISFDIPKIHMCCYKKKLDHRPVICGGIPNRLLYGHGCSEETSSHEGLATAGAVFVL